MTIQPSNSQFSFAFGKRAPSRAVTLQGYVGTNWFRRHRRLCFSLTVLFAALYGMCYTVFGSVFLLQMLMPLPVLAIAVVWALPDTNRPPRRLLGWLLSAYLFALLCWPDYLALALPGLPWITAIRLVGAPLALVFLLCLSLSSNFRAELRDILTAVPIVPKLMLIFTAIGFLTIAMSDSPVTSFNRYITMLLNWVTIFFVSALVFTRKGKVIWLGYTLWGIAVFLCAIAVWEVAKAQVPWANHIPSFLKIEDETVQRVLNGTSRSATGIYRAQSKFTTSLSFGEFLGMALPFIIHIGFTARRLALRVLAIGSLPLVLYVVLATDSRLAMICFLSSLMLYVLAWAVMWWRARRNSLIAPAIIISYPALFMIFIAATFFVGRLRVRVWGTGAHAASNEGRSAMFEQGIPIILRNPIGHGIGQAGEVLGFTNPAGILTIDSYLLSAALDFGIIGFFVYFGMFIIAVMRSWRAAFEVEDRELYFVLPVAIALTNFVVSKTVLSQTETHPLAFLLLGTVVALLARVRADKQRANPAIEADGPGKRSTTASRNRALSLAGR